MGVVHRGALSRQVRARPDMLWQIPHHWSLEEAATVPLPYIHAFYCLSIKHQITSSQNILVVGGAGAFGQAAISIALRLGCEVFTTVGDIRKKEFLLKRFPTLNGENIVNINDPTFADKIIWSTKGTGCDIVITCVTGSLREKILRCCAKYGVAIDVVQVQSHESFQLKMAYLDCDKNYVSVNLSSLFEEENQADLNKLQYLMNEGIKLGYVRPLTSVVYEPSKVDRAFRLIAGRRNLGRVLLKLRKPFTTTHRRLICSADQYHWIICDNEMFGSLWAEKLFSCGVTKLIISCSSRSNYLLLKNRTWQKQGLTTKISNMTIDKIADEILNACQISEKIEGIYFIGTEVTLNQKMESIINKINKSLRENNISNKYFAIVNSDKIIGKQVYLNRINDNLAATFLHIPTLKELDEEQINMPKWRGAIDVIEQALLSEKSFAIAHCTGSTDQALLQKTLHLAGIEIATETDFTLTLQDLKVSPDTLQLLSVILRNNYNTFLKTEEISLLTLKEIQDLHKLDEPSSEFLEPRGLINFISSVSSDEVSAGAEIIILPTRIFSECMAIHNFDGRQPFISIIPGVEGHYEPFKKMCGRLKLNAIVLQSGLENFDKTLPQIAEKYTKILLEKTNIRDNFYLLGYESGALVALEIAAILEERGLMGKVFIIGLLPEELKVYVENQLLVDGITNETSLQNILIKHFINLMNCSITPTEETLLESLTWQGKLELCSNIVKGKVPYTLQYLQAIINETLAQIRRIRSYNYKSRTLKSQIIVMKPKSNLISLNLNNQLYSKQDIIVHELQTSLSQANEDAQCAAIINKYLDSNDLNAFESRNICESRVTENYDFSVVT